MSGDELFADLEKISDYIQLQHKNTAHEDDMQIMKLAEEVGEVVQAWLSWAKQNPRKPNELNLDDVLNELADVIITAWCNIQRFTADPDAPRRLLAERTKKIIKRAEI